MRNESEIRAKLDAKDIFPAEGIGQHILVDQGVISTFVGHNQNSGWIRKNLPTAKYKGQGHMGSHIL